jgi:putative salt-induced outer membrane protein YdiY
MKYFIAVLILFSIFDSNAQILNAESLRKVTDTSGFSGSASLDFSLKRNVNDYVGFSSSVHLQYKMNRHLVLLKNDIELQNIEGNKFENAGISHLRYNYRFHKRIAWEVFTQAQYNKVSKIDFRYLLGTGPRFKLTTAEKYKVYLGTHIMYEHEELSDGITPIQRNLRGTSYLSFSLYPTQTISLVSTTYYQPRLSDFEDYRISSQTSLLIDLFKNFAFKTTYTFTYDEFPAVGIPNSQYDLVSGIVYSFD